MDMELVTKYRDINVDHDWWDYVDTDFKERMYKVGIEVDKIFFSGFWSQGDGACFEGRIDRPLRFLRKHFPNKYPMLRKLIGMKGEVRLYCKQNGRYSHEHCTSFAHNYDTFEAVVWDTLWDDDDDVRYEVVQVMDEQLRVEVQEFEEEAQEIFRDYMRQLYRDLESEYESLTSDEAVWEAIVANELYLPELTS